MRTLGTPLWRRGARWGRESPLSEAASLTAEGLPAAASWATASDARSERSDCRLASEPVRASVAAAGAWGAVGASATAAVGPADQGSADRPPRKATASVSNPARRVGGCCPAGPRLPAPPPEGSPRWLARLPGCPSVRRSQRRSRARRRPQSAESSASASRAALCAARPAPAAGRRQVWLRGLGDRWAYR